jgi:transposase
MIDKRTIFEIHRLKHLGWSNRKIARHLRIDRQSVKKYALNPVQAQIRFCRTSKLDPFRDLIQELLKQDPAVSAPVILQHLTQNGFDGKITIVRDYLLTLRGDRKKRIPYTRFESAPGKQMQIDWGHFGAIDYDGTRRKLYALVVIEAFSRMLYVRFTHSQKQYVLLGCLLEAFSWFGGSPAELVVDNMATAVVERLGSVVRFNDAFLDFLRHFNVAPVACSPAAPFEKGKVESGVKYLRQNFLPLRSFADLDDVQHQVLQWLETVANVRIHQSTGQRPVERFEKVRLNPLPEHLPDCRETQSLLVHKDFAVHPRCWKRKQRIETPSHQQQVKKLQKRLWHDQQVAALLSLGPVAVDYLNGLCEAGCPVKKHVKRLLLLKDRYGADAVIYALTKAMAYKAWGADYVENILHQHMAPKNDHPPVRLKNDDLNRIRLLRPHLADYDAHILKRLKND